MLYNIVLHILVLKEKLLFFLHEGNKGVHHMEQAAMMILFATRGVLAMEAHHLVIHPLEVLHPVIHQVEDPHPVTRVVDIHQVIH